MTTEPTEAPISDDDFLKVCGLLNAAGVRYLIAGGFAVMLHQVPRFTADVDVLIEESEDNYLRVIEALSHLMDGAARELTPRDFAENLVVKIADEVEVDVSRRAWVVTYAEAIVNAREEVIEGVRIPYLGLQDLIRSKQTYRDKDRLDIQMLLAKSPNLPQQAEPPPQQQSRGCLPLGLILWAGIGIIAWLA